MGFIYRKILFTIDDSKNSERAFKRVFELQSKLDCKIVIVHSVKHYKFPLLAMPIVPSSYGSFYVSERELLEETIQEGEQLLLKVQNSFNRENLSVETRLIKEDHPEDYILRIVEDEKFDFVVIGAKGVHSKLKQKLIGLVAKTIVKHASCHVLIVR
ncbi:MAG: universal stress protein [Candidatus Hodarchaeota archaeon]